MGVFITVMPFERANSASIVSRPTPPRTITFRLGQASISGCRTLVRAADHHAVVGWQHGRQFLRRDLIPHVHHQSRRPHLLDGFLFSLSQTRIFIVILLGYPGRTKAGTRRGTAGSLFRRLPGTRIHCTDRRFLCQRRSSGRNRAHCYAGRPGRIDIMLSWSSVWRGYCRARVAPPAEPTRRPRHARKLQACF